MEEINEEILSAERQKDYLKSAIAFLDKAEHKSPELSADISKLKSKFVAELREVNGDLDRLYANIASFATLSAEMWG